ncbi:glycosyltransferase [Rapidithrix thailandica]|uniref:Glycosyltransferase n=1 Tax=Rapidithrix thailandica TaxID=413964 RepID=A0AAW9S354_9BACT
MVIPVYNSAETLRPLLRELTGFFERNALSYEVIMVDDGSEDDSWGQICQLKTECPVLTGIKLRQNSGQHPATFLGGQMAQGKWVITLDDDLQVAPQEIGGLIRKQAQTNATIVYGYYPEKKHSFLRNKSSNWFNVLLRIRYSYEYSVSSFRLIKKDLFPPLSTPFTERLLELFLLKKTPYIGFAAIKHQDRKIGKSGYHWGKLFQLFFWVLMDVLRLPSFYKKRFEIAEKL